MVEWLSMWAEEIIVAVIIATIIEMILPEGSSKKYIKVVVGIYILFTIVSPVIDKFTSTSISVSNLLDLDEYVNEISEQNSLQNILDESNSESVKSIYVDNLKLDIQSKIEAKGYNVLDINVEVLDDESYTLNKIEITVTKEEINNTTINSIEAVNEISISILDNDEQEETEDTLSSSDKQELKEYLNSVYEVDIDSIVVN